MKKASIILFFFIVVPFATFADESVLATSESPDGHIRARLSISPPHPRLSDTIFLTLNVDADQTIAVETPLFGSSLGDLAILETTEQISAASGRETTKIVLKTIPLKAGSLPIWPIPLRYANRLDGYQDQPSVLIVPPSRITVASWVPPESASLEKIGSPYALIDMDKPSSHRILAAIGILLVAGIILFLFLRRCRTRAATVPTLTAQEVALQRLRTLLESRLHESDVKGFFIELSGIVRWYIEQTSNIRAPELTTEEFLRTLGTRHGIASFPVEMRDRLRLFLESADMVKFAKFQPSRKEILLGCQRAEEFLLKSSLGCVSCSAPGGLQSQQG